MPNFRNVISIFLILFLTLVLATPVSFAQDEQNLNGVDSILIQIIDGRVIIVPIDDYGMIYVLKSGALYNYLVNSDKNLDVYGVVSGDKYINLDEYGMSYVLNGSDVAKALEKAEVIDESIVSTFKNIEDIMVELVNLKVGESEVVISGNHICVLCLEEDLNNSIGDLEITFSKPVKFSKVNDKPLISPFIDKLDRSGYNPEGYYDYFRIPIGSTYETFLEYGDKGSISVVTEDGYEITLNIIFKIK